MTTGDLVSFTSGGVTVLGVLVAIDGTLHGHDMWTVRITADRAGYHRGETEIVRSDRLTVR
jgi:hypothetical protein